MSILKYIMRPFVEFKEEEKPGTVPEKPPASSADFAVSAPVLQKPDFSPSPAPPNNSRLADYQKHFEQLIEEANAKNSLFQGTDFKEFMDSKIDVEAITDEGTRYKTAFNVLKRTGLTKEKLLTTGQEYIKIIDSDQKGFEGAYALQYKTDVEQKEQLLRTKAEELKAVNDRIAALNQEMKQISQELGQSKDQLNANKNAFVSAAEDKKKEIQTELQKIAQYF
ncbi:MAG: hypothetical protein WKF97_14560 [Chitinophagaceae bacterium]